MSMCHLVGSVGDGYQDNRCLNLQAGASVSAEMVLLAVEAVATVVVVVSLAAVAETRLGTMHHHYQWRK